MLDKKRTEAPANFIGVARMAGRWASAATSYGYAKTQHAKLH